MRGISRILRILSILPLFSQMAGGTEDRHIQDKGRRQSPKPVLCSLSFVVRALAFALVSALAVVVALAFAVALFWFEFVF